jgi:hypothetical protein
MKQETINELKKLTCRYLDQEETMILLRMRPNLLRFWSWGVSKVIPFLDCGLLLRVNGHHHKGWVFITLNGLDLYDVHLLNCQFKLKESIKDIHFDDLSVIIDNKIERIPEYTH